MNNDPRSSENGLHYGSGPCNPIHFHDKCDYPVIFTKNELQCVSNRVHQFVSRSIKYFVGTSAVATWLPDRIRKLNCSSTYWT
uniref:Uncharacterized protein n=1 Tax=Hyaloperonospora arabidopsidis (strain Emoy2) TaxID=559515 RepID=M4B9H2_HYAAE